MIIWKLYGNIFLFTINNYHFFYKIFFFVISINFLQYIYELKINLL